MDSFTLTLLTDPLLGKRVRHPLVLLLSYFIDITVFNANSVDSDQTPCYAAPDLGLNCLPMFLLWDARHNGLIETLVIINFIL